MKRIDGRIMAFDGTSIYYREWGARNDEKGILVVVHGFAEHGDRYHRIAQLMNDADVRVVAGDLRGHGKTEGKRGHVLRFETFLEDVHMIVDHCSEGAPVFLLGHSLGGLIALLYSLKHPDHIKGMILSSPLLGLRIAPPRWKICSGKLLSRVIPSFSMFNEIDPHELSHDEDEVRNYMNDPLVHDRISARMYTEMIRAMSLAEAHCDELRIPALFLVAGDDPIVSPAQAKRAFSTLGSEDKQYREYENMYHEIFNETERDRVLTDLKQWIVQRIPC
jgi:alpha-beta hydrolase superfamily lysophospholipase